MNLEDTMSPIEVVHSPIAPPIIQVSLISLLNER
jgi:hypothetical protein